jgi:hypothetical protein
MLRVVAKEAQHAPAPVSQATERVTFGVPEAGLVHDSVGLRRLLTNTCSSVQ